MNRNTATKILNKIQNRICWKLPLDVVTFSAFESEGAELLKYVQVTWEQYAAEYFNDKEIEEINEVVYG